MEVLNFEWLNDTAFNTYSQFGEDGIIDAIFSIIRTENRWCLECGAADGLFFSNTRWLIEQEDWHAVLIEADTAAFQKLVNNCEGCGERVTCVNAAVGDNCRLETILHQAGAPIDIDLVVIDVDGQDYHLFNSLLQYRPRVVVVEFGHGCPTDFVPSIGGEGQAGLEAMQRLAVGRLYTEVARTLTNLILVRRPLDRLLSGTREAMLRRVTPPSHAPQGAELICLDLSAGGPSPDGFIPMGDAHGRPIYPLDIKDASIDVVRASHVLEGFPAVQVAGVLADWFRVLKPGGILKIAVPDFASAPVAATASDKAVFDETGLQIALSQAGLMLIGPRPSDLDDDPDLPVSLNFEAMKPHQAQLAVTAVMSTPRLGFMDNMFSAIEALPSLGVRVLRHTGAFWHQCLERSIEEALGDAPDAILALDYDSVFTRADAAMLMQLMCCYPDADAIAAVQAGRGTTGGRLFTIRPPRGVAERSSVPAEHFARDLAQVSTAHFGLTLIRAERLRALPKPWFFDRPAADGSWNEGRTDADIVFWRSWEAAGNSLYLANRVPIGHLELSVLWPAPLGPGGEEPITQPISMWRNTGKPNGVWI